ADAVSHADPMVLRGLVYQLTGDEEILATEVKKVLLGFVEVAELASDQDVARLRQKAVDFLRAYRDSGAGPISIGADDRLNVSMALALGEDIPEAQLGRWRDDLALDPWSRGLTWREAPSSEQLENFSVTVIGTGMGGLNAAVQLKHAGIPFRVIEKN